MWSCWGRGGCVMSNTEPPWGRLGSSPVRRCCLGEQVFVEGGRGRGWFAKSPSAAPQRKRQKKALSCGSPAWPNGLICLRGGRILSWSRETTGMGMPGVSEDTELKWQSWAEPELPEARENNVLHLPWYPGVIYSWLRCAQQESVL